MKNLLILLFCGGAVKAFHQESGLGFSLLAVLRAPGLWRLALKPTSAAILTIVGASAGASMTSIQPLTKHQPSTDMQIAKLHHLSGSENRYT